MAAALPVFSCVGISDWCSADKWTAEDSSSEAAIVFNADTIDIVSPDGLTLWFNERQTGSYTVRYRACVVMEGGEHDRLSDLNCFWGADDPAHPDDFFAGSEMRRGIFPNYNSLNLFYVGFGGNENTTTRFRQYHAEFYGEDDSIVKPLLGEYTDTDHLLQPNRWYDIEISFSNGVTSYSVDGENLFSLQTDECDGYFALRLWNCHVRMTAFRIDRQL